MSFALTHLQRYTQRWVSVLPEADGTTSKCFHRREDHSHWIMMVSQGRSEHGTPEIRLEEGRLFEFV